MTKTPVIDGLNGLLADSTVFYQKLRHYHWNVLGQEFFTLHAKFEELYTAWAITIDQVAERILMLDGVPLHTLKAVLAEARLEEDEAVPAAPEMVDALLSDFGTLRERIANVIEQAESVGDRGTANLLDDVADTIEKDAWMLSAWKRDAARSWN